MSSFHCNFGTRLNQIACGLGKCQLVGIYVPGEGTLPEGKIPYFFPFAIVECFSTLLFLLHLSLVFTDKLLSFCNASKKLDKNISVTVKQYLTSGCIDYCHY